MFGHDLQIHRKQSHDLSTLHTLFHEKRYKSMVEKWPNLDQKFVSNEFPTLCTYDF